jgi:FAD dependent oxidoreductase
MTGPTPYRSLPTEQTVLREPPRDIPEWASVDLCIVGGNAAGLGAAVEAHRAGMRHILLIEQYGFCGGANAAGMSGPLCGLFASGTAQPQLLTEGSSCEFYDRLRAPGGVADPFPFSKTYLAVHEPLAGKELADDYLVADGIYVLYHAFFVDVVRRDRGITHVIVENKNGRGAVAARSFIDASGDANVVALSQAWYTEGLNGVIQAPTMISQMMNVDIPRALLTSPEELKDKVREARKTGSHRLPRSHFYMYPSPRRGEYSCNMTRLDPPIESDKPCLSGLCANDLTYCEIEGCLLVREYERFLLDYIPGFEDAFVNDVGTQIGIRQTRSTVGRTTLKNAGVLAARNFGDAAVTRSAWPIEVHTGGEARIVYLENDYYEIPAACLAPAELSNIWAADRCFSAEHEAPTSAREVAQCLEMGFAAGEMANDFLLSH